MVAKIMRKASEGLHVDASSWAPKRLNPPLVVLHVSTQCTDMRTCYTFSMFLSEAVQDNRKDK